MKESVYSLNSMATEELNGIIQSLKEFAVLHSMPMFITCAVNSTEDETEYRTDVITPAATNRVLADNKFLNLINVMNGAETHYVSESTDIMLDAIRQLPEEIVDNEYSEFSSAYADVDDDEFYGES